MDKTIDEIEDELDALQLSHVGEEDPKLQREIERKFDRLLDEATAVDGKLRVANGVTITNWTRD